MSTILAAIDASAAARPVLDTAAALRTGWPAGRILDVAAVERADLIALGWRRRLAADHAAVVREVLARTPVPVVLLPRSA